MSTVKKGWIEQQDQKYVRAYHDLIKEHGRCQVVVFPLSDEEWNNVELATQLDGNGTIHRFAKVATLEWARCSAEGLTNALKQGKAEITYKRKAKL